MTATRTNPRPDRTHPELLDVQPGGVVAGRYRLGDCIGTGGFAAVYEAIDEVLDRRVAIKVLDLLTWAREEQREECLARFRSEGRAAARIDHPYVVTVHDMGVIEPAGVPFIVMERLRGRDLRDELDQGGPMAPARAMRIVGQSLEALVAAHGMGIVHRDLKPSNLFLVNAGSPTESVRVLDFGIARFLDVSANLTATGQMMGTARFMAPEYVNSGEVSPQSDVYQMGLILCELLSGRPVIEATQFALAVVRASSGMLDLPAELMASPIGPVIERAVALDPANRYRSAGHFLSMLSRINSATIPAVDAAPSAPFRPATMVGAPPVLDSQPRECADEGPQTRPRGASVVIVTARPGGGLDDTDSVAPREPEDGPLRSAAGVESEEAIPGAAVSRLAQEPRAQPALLDWTDDPVTPMWRAFPPMEAPDSGLLSTLPIKGGAQEQAPPINTSHPALGAAAEPRALVVAASIEHAPPRRLPWRLGVVAGVAALGFVVALTSPLISGWISPVDLPQEAPSQGLAAGNLERGDGETAFDAVPLAPADHADNPVSDSAVVDAAEKVDLAPADHEGADNPVSDSAVVDPAEKVESADPVAAPGRAVAAPPSQGIAQAWAPAAALPSERPAAASPKIRKKPARRREPRKASGVVEAPAPSAKARSKDFLRDRLPN